VSGNKTNKSGKKPTPAYAAASSLNDEDQTSPRDKKKKKKEKKQDINSQYSVAVEVEMTEEPTHESLPRRQSSQGNYSSFIVTSQSTAAEEKDKE